MRISTIGAAALFVAWTSTPVLAQPELDDDFEEPSQRPDPWVLDDGRGDALEWPEERRVRPRSLLAVGVQISGGALLFGSYPAQEIGFFESSFVLDLRYRAPSPLHARGVFGVTIHNTASLRLATAEYQTAAWTVWWRAFPLAAELFGWLAARVGPEFGLQWVGGPAEFVDLEFVFGVNGEIGVQWLDRRFEVGITTGLRSSNVHSIDTLVGAAYSEYMTLHFALGAYAIALF